MMEGFLRLHFGISILISVFIGVSKSQQTCSPPDLPVGGNYFPRHSKFQPGDKIIYNCTEGYTLMGKDSSKCKSNGAWSSATPFCDRKAQLSNPFVMRNLGIRQPNPVIKDGNTSTCSLLRSGESQMLTLSKKIGVHAVRIFLERGSADFEIVTGSVKCALYRKFLETSLWDLIYCMSSDDSSNSIRIQDKSQRANNISICEIEVYVKEEDGCEFPPDRKVANGYFEVSRSTAQLMCEDGYKSDNTRLVCEKNKWIGNNLQCDEILCDPQLNTTRSPGTEWTFLDAVKKISAGTRRQLRCNVGYQKSGGPEIIVCQKNGTWTKTTANCVEEAKPRVTTRTIIFGVVGTLVVLIIIILLGTTIHFVRKQRSREVVVVYKSPTDGSVISGSEASGYYESIQSVPPIPSASTRPIAQMIEEGYFLPFDGKDTIKKNPLPADIAFSTLKQSTLYSN